jgi:hypothetical protein
MKTKLDPEEKARRASWREVRYQMPSVPRKHHLTKKERMPSETPTEPRATGNLTPAILAAAALAMGHWTWGKP